jgi:iron complex outermembrane receptor protein
VVPTMKVPFVYALDFSAAIRWEQYTNTGQDPRIVNPITGVVEGPVINITGNNGGTPRITFRYQPYQDLTIRGSWGKSFAQPSFGQLFLPNSQNFPVIFDPLTGITTQPPNGVYQQGNPNLLPEKSDTYTVGFVFTPKQIKGFTLTVDFYQINTTNLIVNPASQAQVFATFNGQAGGGLNAPFALTQAQVNAGQFGVYRDPLAVGDARFPDRINAGYGNSGSRFVEGIDITAIYEWATSSFGKFTFTLGYNHFFYYNVDTGAGFGPTRFVGGNFQSLPLVPGAIPYNKGFFRTEWDYRGFYFGATVNYVGDYLNDGGFLANNSNFQVNTDNANPSYFYSRRSGAYVTLDLQVSYSFKAPKAVDPVYAKDAKGVRTQVSSTASVSGNFWQKLLWGTTLRAGVNNVFDKYPPYDAAAFNDNYDTSTYSIRNRFWYIGINKKF